MNTRIFLTTFVCICLTVPLFAQGPPANSGIVERWEGDGWFRWYADFKRNFVAFHGVDIEAWCAWDENTEWSTWQVQDVIIKGDPEWLVKTTEKGDDMITSVWPIEILDEVAYPDHWCDGVLDLEPIATGTADVVFTDNDLTGGFYEPTPRMNAYHLSAHGLIDAEVDGEQLMFSGGFNCQWPGYPEVWSETGKCKAKIIVH